jgi:transposase
MISKEDFIVIHTLYNKGNNISEIARLTKLDRKTIRKRLKQDELVKSSRVITRPSKLEPYKNYIIDFISKEPRYRIPASVILTDINAMGYVGGRSILQSFLAVEYKKRNIINDPVIRFETVAGEQMQVDWTTIRFGSKPIYGFVATLGYSRYTFVYFTNNMTVDTLISCHELAFLYFGGITKTILYDNMKAVVDIRNHYGRGFHKYNDRLADFAKRHGFKIRLCMPYRAKTKGKVERFNHYLKSNFYRPLVIKLATAKLDITPQLLNQYIYSWLAGANGAVENRVYEKIRDKHDKQ